MPARLRQHALPRIDQHDRKVGGRGAGRHVARVLLVARRVGDDELALRRGEEAVGDIDGDALLALRLQPVDQQARNRCRRRSCRASWNRAPARRADPRRSAWCRRAAGRSASTCRRRPSRRSGSAAATFRPARRDRRGRSAAAGRDGVSALDYGACSEIAFALLLFHRAGLVLVDQAALALRGARGQHLADDALPGCRRRTRSRRSADSSRACGSAPCRFSTASPGRSFMRSSSRRISMPSRSTTGRSLAK